MLKSFRFIILLLLILVFTAILVFKYVDNKKGEQIDKFNDVNVYYNGNVGNIMGRNITSDGYNLGIKYQCVEFVKRYYYERFNHKMPNSYGHAKDFFNKDLSDGKLNKERALIQFSNPSNKKPKIEDLLVFKETTFNEYGHVAIVSKVTDSIIEIVQQNAGIFMNSRETFVLIYENGKWKINDEKVLGWLRKE